MSDHLPKIGAPISWNAGYVAASNPYTIAFPPKSVTRNTRNGRTMLKPKVPVKLINNKGKSEISFWSTLFTV